MARENNNFKTSLAQRTFEGLLPKDLEECDGRLLHNPDLQAYFKNSPDQAFSDLEELSKSERPVCQNMALFSLGSLAIYDGMVEHHDRFVDIAGNLNRQAITINPNGVSKDDFMQVMLETFKNAQNTQQVERIQEQWREASEMATVIDFKTRRRLIV
jgi:hypothetical protein